MVELVIWSSATRTSTASCDSILLDKVVLDECVCQNVSVHVSAASIMHFFLALFFH